MARRRYDAPPVVPMPRKKRHRQIIRTEFAAYLERKGMTAESFGRSIMTDRVIVEGWCQGKSISRSKRDMIQLAYSDCPLPPLSKQGRPKKKAPGETQPGAGGGDPPPKGPLT